jgi:hypothetical protein
MENAADRMVILGAVWLPMAETAVGLVCEGTESRTRISLTLLNRLWFAIFSYDIFSGFVKAGAWLRYGVCIASGKETACAILGIIAIGPVT